MIQEQQAYYESLKDLFYNALFCSEEFNQYKEFNTVTYRQLSITIKELDSYDCLSFLSTHDFVHHFRERWISITPISLELIQLALMDFSKYELKKSPIKSSNEVHKWYFVPSISSMFVLPSPSLVLKPVLDNEVNFDESSLAWNQNKQKHKCGEYSYKRITKKQN